MSSETTAVCVRETERERERKKERDSKGEEKKKENMIVDEILTNLRVKTCLVKVKQWRYEVVSLLRILGVTSACIPEEIVSGFRIQSLC